MGASLCGNRAQSEGWPFGPSLYTRIVAGVQTDEIERWLKREFEDPAEEAISKATADLRLTSLDWHRLIQFVAAQDVRTPRSLEEHLQRGRETMPGVLQHSLEETVRRLEHARETGEAITPVKVANSEYIPLRNDAAGAG